MMSVMIYDSTWHNVKKLVQNSAFSYRPSWLQLRHVLNLSLPCWIWGVWNLGYFRLQCCEKSMLICCSVYRSFGCVVTAWKVWETLLLSFTSLEKETSLWIGIHLWNYINRTFEKAIINYEYSFHRCCSCANCWRKQVRKCEACAGSNESLSLVLAKNVTLREQWKICEVG